MVADHSVFLISLHDHSASFTKAREDRLLESTSCISISSLLLFLSLSCFVEQPCCDLGPGICSLLAALFYEDACPGEEGGGRTGH